MTFILEVYDLNTNLRIGRQMLNFAHEEQAANFLVLLRSALPPGNAAAMTFQSPHSGTTTNVRTKTERCSLQPLRERSPDSPERYRFERNQWIPLKGDA